jgi:tungstate transport system ATP-binding protein
MIMMPGSGLPLRLAEVTYAVGGRILLDRISLDLDPGGRTLVLGPNGAGKSLLMRLCHGLLKASSGQVLWGEQARKSTGVEPDQAMVFQRPVLLRRSTLGNVTYALSLRGVARRDRVSLALEALRRFGLDGLAHQPARSLSGGEQQRLALARAWALRPKIVFLDEPTAALDPAGIRAVEEAVAAFVASGIKIVMSTHDIGQARRLADDIVFLSRGRLIEHTPAAEFFRQPRSLEAAAFLRGDLLC